MTATLRLALLLALALTLSASHGAPAAASVFEAAAQAEEAAASKQRSLQRDIADDHVRVLFCTSCGYQQNFQQIKTYLEDTFPHLVDRVEGANYDVDPLKMLLAQFLGYAQVTAMVLLVFGEYILPALGVDMTVMRWALNNRVAAFFAVVFMGTIASSLTASGAFEIYFNGDLIFSKLETGRWPTLLEISNSIREYGLLDSPAA
ncbi:selt selw selh selenoprotein domain containing protein [Phytophthora cinnamomi]|uniref:selt selw selh selenoprotein domain containing protein n=1 Tax=Phytophthora cinnamomi TaxID=4785 RepID=UPI00355A9EB1|nr:selt selw selh selenoprotein domain containing protein [Phytophthora cinnamomi]